MNHHRLNRRDFLQAGTATTLTAAAAVMGFEADEVPTFTVARQAGLGPQQLAQIEIRGAPLRQVRRRFKKPEVVPWQSISHVWGVKEL